MYFGSEGIGAVCLAIVKGNNFSKEVLLFLALDWRFATIPPQPWLPSTASSPHVQQIALAWRRLTTGTAKCGVRYRKGRDGCL